MNFLHSPEQVYIWPTVSHTPLGPQMHGKLSPWLCVLQTLIHYRDINKVFPQTIYGQP